jgi:predicted O-linked N-acetylglucosamine transferase (SPINDLY family)
MSAKANVAERLHKTLSAGHVFLARGQLSSARNKFRDAVKLAPQDPRGHFFLGAALLAQNNAVEALPALRDADRLAPNNVDVVANLGLALSGVGDKVSARAALERAVAMRPDDDRIKVNLANVLIDLEPSAALELLSGVRGSCDALLARAHALIVLDRAAEALELTRTARELEPDSPDIIDAERVALQKLGRFGDAKAVVDALDSTIAALGGEGAAPVELLSVRASRRIYLDGGASVATQNCHLAAGRRFDATSGAEDFERAPDPERRLRVGFVSPDLREHSVMNFFLAPLAAFDRERISTHLYANVRKPDGITERAKLLAQSHRNISPMDAETAAAQIRKDRIDILIDLAGHTNANRLDVFGFRPAPLQMTWLGYPYSTGMRRIQYRLSDPIADPPDLPRPGYTENFLYLDRFLCFAPLSAPAPARQRDGNAQIVFGAFNNFDKYDDGSLRFWARIMARLPDTSLIIRQRQFGDAETREIWRKRLAASGFDTARVDMGPFDDSRPDAHFTIHDEIDICLDPLIYNGTTTTCYALWMGVPVIVVAGQPHASRVGASIMAAAGLPEFVARDEADAVEKIVALAQDRARLAEYRRTLRNRLQASPLCDAAAFARDFEAKLRAVWREYCAKA